MSTLLQTNPAIKRRRLRFGKRRSSRRSPLWREVLLFAWLAWVYDAVVDFQPVRQHAAVAHGWGVLHFERVLGLAPELSLNHWLAFHSGLGLALSDYYDNAHFIVTFALVGWLWWRRPDLHRPLRNGLVLISAVGFLVYWLYPVAPPRLLPGSGFVDVVATTHAWGAWHSGTLAAHANELAAMPSLHIAWACWCTLALWRLSRRRWVRALALAYPVVTTVVIMATGNHFLADAVAGLATMALATAVVEAHALRRALGRLTPTRPAAIATVLPSRAPAPLAVPSPLAPYPRERRVAAVRQAERARGEPARAQDALPA